VKKNSVKKRVNISLDPKSHKALFKMAESRGLLLGTYLKQIVYQEIKNLNKLHLID